MSGLEHDMCEQLHEIKYRADLSGLYHRKRERFLALCDRVGKAAALVAGTAAFSSLLGTPESKSWAGLAVAGATLPGLVFTWSDKARLHSELAQKYLIIRADIARFTEAEITEKKICEWDSQLRELEATEPPTLTALVRICQNQIARAAGQPEKCGPLTLIEKTFAHIFDMQISAL